MRKPIGERIVHQMDGWLRVKHNGSLWTIMPSVVVFGLGVYFVSDVGEDQTQITNTRFLLKPNSFVSLKYSSFKKIASRLSTFAQPIVKPPLKYPYPCHLNITPQKVEEMIRECLKTKKYLAVGKNVIQIFFVINSYLKRKHIDDNSRWITVVGSDRRGWFSDYMKISASKLMREHVSIIPSVGMEKQEKEESLEERLYKKLKRKLKGE